MKIKRFWGYLRLCLCLFFGLGTSSCAVKKPVFSSDHASVAASKADWEMLVKYNPGYESFGFGYNALLMEISPLNAVDFKPTVEQVFTYFNITEEQVQAIKFDLLSTGMVAKADYRKQLKGK